MLSLPSMRTGLLAKKSLGQITFKRDINVSRVSFPEEDGLQLCSDGRVVPVFTENICRVLTTLHMIEASNASGNIFASAMVREHVVSLVELGMWNRSGVDDRFIVSKHHGVSINGDSKISKGHAEVNDLIRTSPGCNIL